MYQLTNDPAAVINLDTGAWIPEGNWMWGEYQAWLDDGNTPAPATDDPTTTADYQMALRSDELQNWLDTTAQENNYADATSCISYLASEVAIYAADAKAMSAWRDAVWPAFNAMPENWPSDPMQWPLWDAIQPLLPQPAEFGWAQHDPVNAPPAQRAVFKRVRI